MAYGYHNLLRSENTASGLAEQVLIAPVSWFAPGGLQAPANEDAVEILTSHVFAKPTYGFFTFQLAPEKNGYDAKTVGERGSQKLEHELKIFIPGSYRSAHETVKAILNEPIIALQRDANCEQKLWYQFGIGCDPAFMKIDFTTGTTKDGVKGYTGTISFVSESVLLYSGTIQKANS